MRRIRGCGLLLWYNFDLVPFRLCIHLSIILLNNSVICYVAHYYAPGGGGGGGGGGNWEGFDLY